MHQDLDYHGSHKICTHKINPIHCGELSIETAPRIPTLSKTYLNVIDCILILNYMQSAWKMILICPTITMLSTTKFSGFNRYCNACFSTLHHDLGIIYLLFSTHKMILRKHPHVLIACMNKNNSSAYYCL